LNWNETKKIGFAGKILSENQSDVVVDGHQTVAEYIDPDDDELLSDLLEKIPDQQWFA